MKMKRFLGVMLAIAVILSSTTFSQPAKAATAGDVVINEASWMGTTYNTADEWIELYNTTSSAISLTGWTLNALDGTPSITLSGSIAANGYFLLERTDDSTVLGIAADLIYVGAMGNTGEDLSLKDGANVLIDRVDAWHAGDNTTNATMERTDPLVSGTIASNWNTSTTAYDGGLGTPKALNSNSTPPGGGGGGGNGQLQIHHINIGQGDSTLVVGPTGKTLLLDAGESYWNSSADAQKIGPYIQSITGSTHLDYVVISHFQVDHVGYVGYGGLWNLVETQGFTVGNMIHRDYNNYLGTTSGTLDNWKTYLAGAGKAKLNPLIAVEGTSQINLGTGVIANIVATDGHGALKAGVFTGDAAPPSENDYSIGVKITYGLYDEWVGGDLSGEYSVSGFGYSYHDIELKTSKDVGDVDVYRVNHHGSDHSSNPTFVCQLSPEVSIISVGDANTYGHPRQPVMDRLLPVTQVYMTERGDINTNVGNAIVSGDTVIMTNGTTYTVDGANSRSATNPTRTDADGDKYFAGCDPNDNNASTIPASFGGYDTLYQP